MSFWVSICVFIQYHMSATFIISVQCLLLDTKWIETMRKTYTRMYTETFDKNKYKYIQGVSMWRCGGECRCVTTILFRPNRIREYIATTSSILHILNVNNKAQQKHNIICDYNHCCNNHIMWLKWYRSYFYNTRLKVEKLFVIHCCHCYDTSMIEM